MNNILLVIPAYNPNFKLIKYIEELQQLDVKNILLINDGSKSDCDEIFRKAKEMGCLVEEHIVNQGKGRALKTAFIYYLRNQKNKKFLGVVTADSDGQHSPNDTVKVMRELCNADDKLILGTRNFDGKDVPIKSKFGNKITTKVFQYLFGIRVNDTQTGLRGILNNDIVKYLKLDGEKFDYEINMLIHAAKETKKSKILEIEIATIYEDNNSETHFNPILDSIKIYKIMLNNFFTFISSSLISCSIDIVLFHFFITMFTNIFSPFNLIYISTILSRCISAVVNFLLNKNVVFESSSSRFQPFKYALLAITQLSLSALLVYITSYFFSANLTIIKIMIDALLFCASYYIQRRYVFGSNS